jgi:hypothetical protein
MTVTHPVVADNKYNYECDTKASPFTKKPVLRVTCTNFPTFPATATLPGTLRGCRKIHFLTSRTTGRMHRHATTSHHRFVQHSYQIHHTKKSATVLSPIPPSSTNPRTKNLSSILQAAFSVWYTIVVLIRNLFVSEHTHWRPLEEVVRGTRQCKFKIFIALLPFLSTTQPTTQPNYILQPILIVLFPLLF